MDLTQNANIVHVGELGLILHGLVNSLETKKFVLRLSIPRSYSTYSNISFIFVVTLCSAQPRKNGANPQLCLALLPLQEPVATRAVALYSTL
jgi:hypothetical protein